MTKEIQLTKGLIALIDDVDYDLISRHRWAATRNSHGEFYAATRVTRDGKQREIKMHRLIMNPGPKMQVDHIDHNCLNNTRANLRLVTNQQNHWNMKPHRDRSNPYKGVTWNKQSKTWQAGIYVDKKQITLGQFADPESAARAYDAAAREHFGEFAFINFK